MASVPLGLIYYALGARNGMQGRKPITAKQSRDIEALAKKARLLARTPVLTRDAAAIVLGIRGAKTRARAWWPEDMIDAEVKRVSRVRFQKRQS
jgi:hypothetical protein